MDARTFLAELRARGGDAQMIDGYRLRLTGPTAALSGKVRGFVDRNQSAILAELSAEDDRRQAVWCALFPVSGASWPRWFTRARLLAAMASASPALSLQAVIFAADSLVARRVAESRGDGDQVSYRLLT